MKDPQAPWKGIVIGGGLVVAWYIATRTTIVLAYKAGTLSQVQGICDSSTGRLARALSAQGAADCSHIDSISMWWNLAGFAGLALVIGCGAWLIYRSQRTSSAASAQ